MRTSRISRDTARMINAMPSRQSMPRRSARLPLPAIKTENLSSDLSSPPSSPVDSLTQVPSPATSTTPARNGKRKREDTITVKTEVEPDLTPRSSPLKVETNTLTTSSNPDSRRDTFPRKPRRQPAKRIKGPTTTTTDGVGTTILKVEPPPNWERVYSITAEMRKKVLAPVDTMGCESAAEDSRSPIDRRLQTLVALMLSSQTKDTVTFAAMRNLQEHLPGGFTLSSLLAVEPDTLNGLIAKVGFHNNKTRYIKATAERLVWDFDGDIPDTIDGLISLPGVGPKMAYLCMSSAWGRDEGIGVDVHVHRITNLWAWHKTKTPEETRMALEEWLPREKWHDINHLLVGFGQMICLPVGRKCTECDLAKEGLCPSAVVPTVARKRVKREVISTDGVIKTEDCVETRVKLEEADGGALSTTMSPAGRAVPDIEGI